MQIEPVNSYFKKAETDTNTRQNTVKNENELLFEPENKEKNTIIL